MALRRRKTTPTFVGKVLRLFAIARLAVRAWRVYRKGRGVIRAAVVAALTGLAALVLRRLQAGRRHQAATSTFAPPPTPTVTPGPPPLDAAGDGQSTATERNLEAEKTD